MDRLSFVKHLYERLGHPLRTNFSSHVVVDWSLTSSDEITFKQAMESLAAKVNIPHIIDVPENLFQFKVDYEYMEDYATNEWVYSLRFDPHEVYCHLTNIESEPQTIYRLASVSGDGVFNVGLDRFIAGASKYSPEDSEQVKQIMKSPLRSAEWKFGCATIEDVKEWVGSEENLYALQEKGIKLWELSVLQQHIVPGVSQLIYRGDRVLASSFKELNVLTLQDNLIVAQSRKKIGPK